MHILWSLLPIIAVALLLVTNDVEAACGDQHCPVSQPIGINVHLVPHSHDDVGWLKTFDQYYYGNREDIQRAGVKNILEAVIMELLKEPSRRFIYAEMAYFFKWYHSQNEKMKKDVEQLVNDGRLEFVGGGWSANDEATVHYQSVIDQYTLGLQEISKHFGTCGRPHSAWLVDSYGHSREIASIFAQLGFDGEFFARVDWVDKAKRLGNLDAEMIWRASKSLGERSDMFTGILYDGYSAPANFCFDLHCVDEPIVDGKSYDNNVQKRIDEFITYITVMAEKYHTTDLLVPMGDDFNYENAIKNFGNMDKLIKYINLRQDNGSRIHAFYSTPSCYLRSLHKKHTHWPVKKSDFFPYSTDPHSYWTGFYTSRPALKRFERDANHFLQVVKQLSALAKLPERKFNKNIDDLRKIMGIMQAHNAITGTQRQNVANDYARLLTDGILSAQNTARVSLQKLTNLTTGEFQSCHLLNISECHVANAYANNLVLTLVNPLAHKLTQYIRLPVKNNSYIVLDSSYNEIPTQTVPLPKELIALPFRSNETEVELVFQATVDKMANYYVKSVKKSLEDAMPSFHHQAKHRRARAATDNPTETTTETSRESVKRSRVARKKLSESNKAQHDMSTSLTIAAVENTTEAMVKVKERPGRAMKVGNSLVKVSISKSGHLVGIEMNGLSEDVRQDFFYYEAAAGNNWYPSSRSSGAYIFRPNSTAMSVGSKVQVTLYEGQLVKEVHQRFNDWISQVVRIYEGVNRVELEWMVGPIPVKDKIGKEVISRFTTSIHSDGVFWTDANGREMKQRTLDKREYFTPNVKQPISSNYYPVTTRIAIENRQRRFAVLTDRAQGGSSVQNGSVELMVHRRLLHDDGIGIGEALNEVAYKRGLIVRGKMYMMLSSSKQKPTYYERLAEKEIHLPFWKFFSKSSRKVKIAPMPDFSYIPREIELLSLENFGSVNQTLLRLENIMDHTETATVTLNIRSIFDDLQGQTITETTLDGSQVLSDMKRLKFLAHGDTNKKPEFIQAKHVPLLAKKSDPATSFIVTLDAMQIRTFLIGLK